MSDSDSNPSLEDCKIWTLFEVVQSRDATQICMCHGTRDELWIGDKLFEELKQDGIAYRSGCFDEGYDDTWFNKTFHLQEGKRWECSMGSL